MDFNPVGVVLAQEQDIEYPVEGTPTTLPVHVLAHLGQPGDLVRVTLRWSAGVELARVFTLLRGPSGRGLLIGNVDWDEGARPPLPASQGVVVELSADTGTLLHRREVMVLGPDDPELREVTLYWVDGDTVQPVQRRIPRTRGIATATLKELLWGPAPGDPATVTTALPTPREVLDYPGRAIDWGLRAELRQVRITDGVATADFSRELGAYGGGSTRVGLIEQQITRTLEQFPGIRDVRIAIEGETGGVLEP